MGKASGEVTKAVLDDKELKAYLAKLKGKVTNIIPILKLAYMTFGFKDIMEHFESESSPEGKWQPWSKTYSEFMKSIGKGGNKKLQNDGTLRNSLLATRSGERVVASGNNAISIFSNEEYSRVHDLGYKNIPQRQFMWFSNSAMENMVMLLLDKVVAEE